jgi:predicted esterase
MTEKHLTAKNAQSAKEAPAESYFRVFRVFRGPLSFCSVRSSPTCFLAVLLGLLVVGALFWAKSRDPFERIWFKVKAPGQEKAQCIAVLPKTAPRPLPVVVYHHGSGGSLLSSGNELRQMAEMGLAAVGIEYCQTNEAVFEAQFSALLNHLSRQRWADTSRMAWVGFSLGAQRSLAYALRHADCQPRLLLRLAGGWVPELESKVQSLKSKVHGAESKVEAPPSEPSTLNSQLSTSVLLFHGERDEVFPLSQAEGVAACLRTNGVPVELKVLPAESHSLGANRLLVFRSIGEQCLVRLEGPGALANYRSILSWQAQAKPLWMFWTPALMWVAIWLWLHREVGQASCLPLEKPLLPRKAGTQEGAGAEGLPEMGLRDRSPAWGAGSPLPRRWREPALRWLAVILATAALAQTAVHLVPPRLATSERTLSLARKHLVQAKELSDFDFLAANPVWRGKPLKTLLEHAELAHYNRELINWKLDEQVYREFVLSAQIDPAADGELNWRRALWENVYPRIRREQDSAGAAEIVVRFLRERVTIAQGSGLPSVVAETWQRQITSERGFEAAYVAAMRSVGVPSRLGAKGRAEFWTGAAWQAAPRPLVERCE